MSCEKCRELLWEYLAQELTKEENDFVLAHLMECESCQKETEQLKIIMDSMKSLPEEELPEGYHAELMGKLAQEEKVITLFPRKKPQYKWKQFGLIAAGILLVAIFGGTQGILNMRGQNELMQKMAAEAEQSHDSVENATTDQSVGADDNDDAVVQYQKVAPDTGTADKQTQKKVVAQETASQEEQESVQNVQEETLEPPVSQKVEPATEESLDEVAPELKQAEARGMLFAQNESQESPQVQRQVILTVASTEGVLDQIWDLTVSLGGYEGGQTLEDSIELYVPSDKTENFMDGLSELGETRSIEETSEDTEMILFKVTLETE